MSTNKKPAVLVEASPNSPEEALAAIETVALLTGEERGKWHIIHVEWPWERVPVGVLYKHDGLFIRRTTGGTVFEVHGETVYTALIGPRTGTRPWPLSAVYELARNLLKPCNPGPVLRGWCGKSRVVAAVGKLAQRALIEVMGPGEVVESLVHGEYSVVARTYLPKDIIRKDSIERLRSEEWNWRPVDNPTHSFRVETSQGFTLELEARLDPPFIEELKIYGDIFVYPPAQALLLIGQLQMIPPARTAVLEFLNGWATLVETVGASYEDIRRLLVHSFDVMMGDAGL